MIHGDGEGTDNFILALVERSYFTTRASRRYRSTCSGGEIGHLSSSPPPSSRWTNFPFAEGFLEYNTGACIHLPRGPARCTARSPSIIITKVLQTHRRVKTIRISRAGNYDVVRAMPRLLLRLLSRRAYVCACICSRNDDSSVFSAVRIISPFFSLSDFLSTFLDHARSFSRVTGLCGSRSLRLFPIAGCMRNFVNPHFPLSSLLRRLSVDNVFYSGDIVRQRQPSNRTK